MFPVLITRYDRSYIIYGGRGEGKSLLKSQLFRYIFDFSEQSLLYNIPKVLRLGGL